MSTAAIPSPLAAPKPRGIRWWPAVLIVVAAVLVIVVIQAQTYARPSMRNVYSQLAAIVASNLLVLWFALASRTTWRVRLAGLALVGLCAAGFAAAIEKIGFSGDMWLEFRWRGTAPRVEVSSSTAVDLAATTPLDYPGFLGVERDGRVRGVTLARDWHARPPRLVWRQPIGSGWSSFAIVGPYALTQEQREKKELVVCYRIDDGKQVWSHADDLPYHSVIAGDGPRATPTVHEGRVYTLGASGRLNCLEGSTGKPVWSVDVLHDAQAQNLQWGMSSSPLVVDGLVIIGAGGTANHSLVAYHASDGRPAWNAGNDPTSYASPQLALVSGVRQILMLNGNSVTGHDPLSGAVLWRFPWETIENHVSQIVPYGGDRVFSSSGYGFGCGMYRLVPTSNVTIEPQEVFRNRNLRTKFTNVVIRDGHIFGLDEGILACIDAESGDRRWKRGRYGHGQILLVDDLILVQAESGEVALVEANPEEYRELGRFSAIDGKTWNNSALSGSRLLVRNAVEAACYELPLVDAPAMDPPPTCAGSAP